MNYIKFILFQQEYKKEGAISHSFTFFEFSLMVETHQLFLSSHVMVETYQLFQVLS